MQENSRQESANLNLLSVLKIKLYWNTTLPICLWTVYGYFHLMWENWVVTTETVWFPKPKIFTRWPFK